MHHLPDEADTGLCHQVNLEYLSQVVWTTDEDGKTIAYPDPLVGTDIGSALLEFSSSFRTTLRQRADAPANKARVWMAFPTVLCLWVAAAIVLVVPIYFYFWHRRNDVYEIFQLRAEKLRKERERREKAFETGPQAMPVPEAAEEPEQ